MSSPKPVVLLLHGLWHQPGHHDLQLQALRDAGYTAHCPQLPSYGAGPTVGLTEDAARIRQELDVILTPDERGAVPDVVVYGHSYGSIVMADAVLPRYSKRNRTFRGEKGGVVRLIYTNAFLLVPGQSLVDALLQNGHVPPHVEYDNAATCIIPEADRVNSWYHDITPEQQTKYLALNKRCPTITLLATTSHAPFLHIPTTYCYCTGDRAMPIWMQKWMVGNAEIMGAQIDTAECSASHSPYISQPGFLVKLLDNLPDASAQDLSAKHQERTAELGAIFKARMAARKAAD